MYFLSGEATCLKVMPACVVMSVKAILVGCWLRTVFSRSGATAQSKNMTRRVKSLIDFRCAVASLREKFFIDLSSAPCLLTLSTSRAVSRPQLCALRQCMHGRVDNEHGPERVASARRSQGSQRCPLRRLSVATLCQVRNAHQRSRVAHERSPALT